MPTSDEQNAGSADARPSGEQMRVDLTSLRSASVARLGRLDVPIASTPMRFEFDQGLVDADSLPYDELKSAVVTVIERDHDEALQYLSQYEPGHRPRRREYRPSYSELFLGYVGLRDRLAEWVRDRQKIDNLSRENFMLLSGTSQVFPLAATAFIDPGDVVLVESLTLSVAEKAFRLRGAEIRRVEMDDRGLVVEALERELAALRAAGRRVKLLYTIPTFHMPTGSVLPVERRRRLLELARTSQFAILEDCVYAEMRYEGDPVPSLFSLDDSGLVVQLHGFAKTFAPGVRLGWACGRKEMIEALQAARCDFGVSQLMCRVMAELLARGVFDAHLERMNAVYRYKRDRAAAALREHCGQWLDFETPAGGMFFWLKLRAGVDPERAQREWASAGVNVRVGQRFGNNAATYLRLVFTHASLDELDEGIKALGEALARAAGARSHDNHLARHER